MVVICSQTCFSRSSAFAVSMLLLPLGCITDREPIPWARWQNTYPAHASQPLARKAREIEDHLVESHLTPVGVLGYALLRTTDGPEPGGIAAYDNLADQTIWTGALATAYALKYRSTGADDDRHRLLQVLRGMKLLHDVTGKPGLFARAIHPADRPVRAELPRHEWRGGAPGAREFRYRGDVSKDQYFGVLLAYATVTSEFDLDATSGDRELHALITEPARAVADHIWENGLNIIDADGERTRHGDLAGYFLGIPIGPNAQLALGFQLLAHRLSGETRFRQRYKELLERGYAEATANNKFEIFGRTNHNNDNMATFGLYALTTLEPDASVRTIYEESLAELWRVTRHEGYSFFHAACASRWTLPPFALHDLRENLRLITTDPRVYPVDVKDSPHVEPSWFHNRFGVEKNRTALPAHLRARSSFVWARCPFALAYETPHPGKRCVCGVDFLVAYWMAFRHLGDPDDVNHPVWRQARPLDDGDAEALATPR